MCRIMHVSRQARLHQEKRSIAKFGQTLGTTVLWFGHLPARWRQVGLGREGNNAVCVIFIQLRENLQTIILQVMRECFIFSF